MRHETLPADHLFGRRVEMLTLAVLSQLRVPRELPPHRARVDVRRAAGHRARAAGGRLLFALISPGCAARSASARGRVRARGHARATSPRTGCATGSTTPACGRRSPSSLISASLTVVLFPGPLLAGASRAAVRHRARLPAQPHGGRAGRVAGLPARPRRRARRGRAARRPAGGRAPRPRRRAAASSPSSTPGSCPASRTTSSTTPPGSPPIALRRSPPRPRWAPPRAPSPTPRSAARSTTSARPRRSWRSPCSW